MANDKKAKPYGKGIKLSEKSLQTRMQNKKARKRSLVRYFRNQSSDSNN